MFSFLFGLGFALQLRKGEGVLPRFRRRLRRSFRYRAHSPAADLVRRYPLFTYAVLGFILILFRNKKDRTLLIAALFMWLFTTLVLAFLGGDDLLPTAKPGEGVAPVGDTYLSIAHRSGSSSSPSTSSLSSSSVLLFSRSFWWAILSGVGECGTCSRTNAFCAASS